MRLPLYALTTALVLAVSTPQVLAAASKDETAVRDHCAAFIAAWNKHDAKAMAATWAEDGSLINPFGRIGNNRAEVEKILALEHGAVMKASTYKAEIVSVKFVEPNVAVADWNSEITGMVDEKGNALPPFKHRVCLVVVKKDGKWSSAAARAYADLPPPPPSS